MDQKQFGTAMIVIAVLIMVFAQLLFKNRLTAHGAIPLDLGELPVYLWQLMQDWKVWTAGFSIIFAAFLWYAAVSRVPLSYAFPVAAISYPMIFVCSILFLGESFSYTKLIGNLFVLSGVLIVSSGSN